MKKILLLVCGFILAVSGICAAEDIRPSDWVYKVRDDGTAVITGYAGEEPFAVIPEVLDGHAVTSMACDAFWFNENLRSVEIPESLIEITAYVYGIINRWASFRPDPLYPEVARSLTDQFAEEADAKQVNPFLGCKNLEEIRVSAENPVFASADGVLTDKAGHRMISYPAGWQEDAYAVPEGITSIGFQCFFGTGLKSVSLPESLNEMDQNPFIFSPDLEEITVSPENQWLGILDGALVSKTGTLIAVPAAADLSAYTIPEGIASIGPGAFFNNQSLTSVSIPGNTASIGMRAFDYCFSLQAVELSEGLQAIGNSAFKNCESLREIILPKTLTYVAGNAFENIGEGFIFTAEKDSYGALWAELNQYRFHFPGEPEKKSRLRQFYEGLFDEDGNLRKYHFHYRADNRRTGGWLIRDVYISHGVTFMTDENDKGETTVIFYKDGIKYKLDPESRTGIAVADEHWSFEGDGIINESKRLMGLIRSYLYRMDYTEAGRMIDGVNGSFRAEVFPEYRYGPETAFYFDREGRLCYCYENKYHGLSPAGTEKSDHLFTIYALEKDFDESVFDISEYEITGPEQ